MKTVTKHSNWRYFAVVTTVSSLCWWAFVSLLDRFTTFVMPEAAGIGVYAAAVMIAGRKFAVSTGWEWTPQDRHRLTVAYAVVSVPLAIFVIGLNIGLTLLESSITQLIQDLSHPIVWAPLVIGVALSFPLNYVLARFFLSLVKPTGDKRTDVRLNADKVSK